MKKLLVVLLIILVTGGIIYATIPNEEQVLACYLKAIEEVSGNALASMDGEAHLAIYPDIEEGDQLKQVIIEAYPNVTFTEPKSLPLDWRGYSVEIEKATIRRFVATVELGYGTGSLSGEGYKVRLRYSKGQWQVISVETIWVS